MKVRISSGVSLLEDTILYITTLLSLWLHVGSLGLKKVDLAFMSFRGPILYKSPATNTVTSKESVLNPVQGKFHSYSGDKLHCPSGSWCMPACLLVQVQGVGKRGQGMRLRSSTHLCHWNPPVITPVPPSAQHLPMQNLSHSSIPLPTLPTSNHVPLLLLAYLGCWKYLAATADFQYCHYLWQQISNGHQQCAVFAAIWPFVIVQLCSTVLHKGQPSPI